MARKIVAVLLTVIILLLVIVGAISLTNNSQPPQIPYKHPPMISGSYVPSNVNVSQGSTFEINITLTSLLETELILPFESIDVMGFNDSSTNIPKGILFSFNFDKNPLIIEAVWLALFDISA